MLYEDPNDESSSGILFGLSELNSSVSRDDSESFTRACRGDLPVLLSKPVF